MPASDAFICYSRRGEGHNARVLQRALHRIGVPWYRYSPIRVFRDTTSLDAGESLSELLQKALKMSRSLILMACPESAQSKYVRQELEFWREHCGKQSRFFMILTGGTVLWDPTARDFNWEQTTAVSHALRGFFQSEPHWLDLRWTHRGIFRWLCVLPAFSGLWFIRYRDAVATIAAPLEDTTKESLMRTEMRRIRLRIILLLVFVALSSTLGYWQANESAAQRIALEAHARMTKDAEQGLLLAVQALRRSSSKPVIRMVQRATMASRVRRTLTFAARPGELQTYWKVTSNHNGQAIAAASTSGLTLIWNGANVKPVMDTSCGHTFHTMAVSFSHNDKWLASAGSDGVHLCDPSTGAAILTFKGHWGWVYSVAFSPDDQRVVSGGTEAVRIWDRSTGRQMLEFPTSGEVRSGGVNSDGTKVAAAILDNTAAIWDVWSRKRLFAFTAQARVNSVAFSPDGRTLAMALQDGTVRLRDLSDKGQEVLSLRGHKGPIDQVAFSPDGSLIVTASEDQSAKVWDALNGVNLLTFYDHKSAVESAVFSASGKLVLTAGFDGYVRVWDASLGLPTMTFPDHEHTVSAVAFSPDGKTIATGSYSGAVHLWDAKDGQPLHNLRVGELHGLAFSPGSGALATVGQGFAALWDPATMTPIQSLPAPMLIDHVSFSSDGKSVVTSSYETATIWDVATAEKKTSFRGTRYVRCAAFSPDGTLLGVSGDEATDLWNLKTGKLYGVLRDSPSGWITFSPDGRKVATAGGEAVKLWDVATRRKVLVLTGHQGVVNRAVFSPDGSRIATGGSDGTARLWDASTGQELLVLHGHGFGVESLAFSPDGRRMVTGSGDHTAKVWDVGTEFPPPEPSELLKFAKTRSTRTLTAEECKQYLGQQRCPE